MEDGIINVGYRPLKEEIASTKVGYKRRTRLQVGLWLFPFGRAGGRMRWRGRWARRDVRRRGHGKENTVDDPSFASRSTGFLAVGG